MSAFILDKAHIDVLVTAGLESIPSTNGIAVTWIGEDGREWARLTAATSHAVGAMLWRENYLSVNARYGDNESVPDYRHDLRNRRGDPVAVLKAIACYEYQSCEHEGWESSAAKRFCDALRRRMIQLLPGYDAAEWSIGDEPVAAC